MSRNGRRNCEGGDERREYSRADSTNSLLSLLLLTAEASEGTRWGDPGRVTGSKHVIARVATRIIVDPMDYWVLPTEYSVNCTSIARCRLPPSSPMMPCIGADGTAVATYLQWG